MLALTGCAGLKVGRVTPASVQEAAAYSAKRGERALIILRAGEVLLERGDTRKDFPVYSITKSVAALGALEGAGAGWLSLGIAAASEITVWREDPDARRIRVEDLLSQTSGLPPASRQLYGGRPADVRARAVALRPVKPPGRIFDYGPSHYEALGAVLERKLKTRGIPVETWVRRQVLAPMGITAGPRWRKDGRGQVYLSTGLELSASDLVALAGYMMSDSGGLILPVRGVPANPLYARGFWLNRNAAAGKTEIDVEDAIDRVKPGGWGRYCLSRQAPADLTAMVGSFGQRVYVSRSRGLVVARLGRSSAFRDPEFLRRLFAL